jgi:hypothetical protein
MDIEKLLILSGQLERAKRAKADLERHDFKVGRVPIREYCSSVQLNKYLDNKYPDTGGVLTEEEIKFAALAAICRSAPYELALLLTYVNDDSPLVFLNTHGYSVGDTDESKRWVFTASDGSYYPIYDFFHFEPDARAYLIGICNPAGFRFPDDIPVPVLYPIDHFYSNIGSAFDLKAADTARMSREQALEIALEFYETAYTAAYPGSDSHPLSRPYFEGIMTTGKETIRAKLLGAEDGK